MWLTRDESGTHDSCALQALTSEVPVPLLKASAQLLFCTEHDRWIAATALTKVASSVEKASRREYQREGKMSSGKRSIMEGKYAMEVRKCTATHDGRPFLVSRQGRSRR
jgi:hypothetical protein